MDMGYFTWNDWMHLNISWGLERIHLNCGMTCGYQKLI